MGWKVSAIIINTLREETNIESILKSIGYDDLEKIDDMPFDSVIYPDGNDIYIGIYKGNLIITAQELPLYFIDLESNEIEKRFIKLFPDAEICALSLNSTINHWAFSVIQNGKKVRTKAGDINSGTIIDFGQSLEEELQLLSGSRLNAKGQREYNIIDSGEFDREDQVGEEFVFEIAKRYLDERLDKDEDLFETVFWGYRSHSFAGPRLMDLTYCGVWSGHYTYGQGYRDSIKGASRNFLIQMDVVNGTLKGTSKEEDKEPATINGFIVDNFIGFVHQYPVKYSFNEKGESVADSAKPGSRIYYSGLFDQTTNSFRGIWRIEGRNNWGEWAMKKKV
jgi:hypothetical protein